MILALLRRWFKVSKDCFGVPGIGAWRRVPKPKGLGLLADDVKLSSHKSDRIVSKFNSFVTKSDNIVLSRNIMLKPGCMIVPEVIG